MTAPLSQSGSGCLTAPTEAGLRKHYRCVLYCVIEPQAADQDFSTFCLEAAVSQCGHNCIDFLNCCQPAGQACERVQLAGLEHSNSSSLPKTGARLPA